MVADGEMDACNAMMREGKVAVSRRCRSLSLSSRDKGGVALCRRDVRLLVIQPATACKEVDGVVVTRATLGTAATRRRWAERETPRITRPAWCFVRPGRAAVHADAVA